VAYVATISERAKIELRKFMENKGGVLEPKYLILKTQGAAVYNGAVVVIDSTSDVEGAVYNVWQAIVQPDSDLAEQTIDEAWLIGNTSLYTNITSLSDAISIVRGDDIAGIPALADVQIMKIDWSSEYPTLLGGRADTFNVMITFDAITGS
jgi:hypothetical protein